MEKPAVEKTAVEKTAVEKTAVEKTNTRAGDENVCSAPKSTPGC
ncbi:MAG: hypothetical protein ACI9QA_000724 [Methanobacteriota archaeon]